MTQIDINVHRVLSLFANGLLRKEDIYWWLVESHHSGLLLSYCLKILGRWRRTHE